MRNYSATASRRVGARPVSVFLVISAVALAGCQGGDKTPDATDSSTPQSAASQPIAAQPAGFDPATITPAMIALGDSLYHGLIGATSCQACHGADGTQATVAPNLVDDAWLHSDGSWEGIYNTVKSGVMAPKQFSSIMPPYGGAPLTEEKTRAVAAYVYSLSHK